MSQAAENSGPGGLERPDGHVGDQGQFVGVLPEGDILRAGLPDIQEIIAAVSSLDGAFERFVIEARDMSSLPISHLVIRNAITLDPDDHVAKAAVVFVDGNIRVLPVVREGRLLGALSRADICAALVGELSRLRSMSTEPAQGASTPAASVLVAAGRRNANWATRTWVPSRRTRFSASAPPPRHLPGDAAWTQAAENSRADPHAHDPQPPRRDPAARRIARRAGRQVPLRAANVIGLLNQAYNNVPIRAPDRLPEQLGKPWVQIAERLSRPALTLNTNDYIWFDYRLIDPDAADPMRADNMRVLTDISGHPQIERFMLVTLEMMAPSAPVVSCTVRAQEAAARHDDDALRAELAEAAETVRDLTFVSLPKINTNSRSGRMRVDPVIWTKLFAMLPLPVMGAEGVRNAGGVERRSSASWTSSSAARAT